MELDYEVECPYRSPESQARKFLACIYGMVTMARKRKKLIATQKNARLEGSRTNRQTVIEQVETMIQAGKPEAAIQLLKPLAQRYKRDGGVQYYLGYAYARAGRMWQSLPYYKKALEITRDPELWLPLGYLYLDLDLRALARNALQQGLRHSAHGSSKKNIEHDYALLNEDLRLMAEIMRLSRRAVQEGMQYMEEGQIALQNGEYLHCISLNRKAIKLLGEYPPPFNNLSLAQFFHGQPQEAVLTAECVLENNPGNIHAIANLIRFLAWTGQTNRANVYWQKLQQHSPEDGTLRFKILEAAAIIEDDQKVYELGKEFDAEYPDSGGLMSKGEFYLAVAEANLGMRSAKRRLQKLKDVHPLAEQILSALRNSQSGLGWSHRFPYFHSSELIPGREFERLFNYYNQERITSQRSRSEIKRWVERFPQVVLIAKKFILEEQKPELGIQLLEMAGTPDAYETLREFGSGQLGSSDDRMDALNALFEAKQIQPGATVRFWKNNEWRDVQLQHFNIMDEGERPYSPQVIKLLNQGLEALHRERDIEAEKLFERVMTLEPNATEAYNNLGTICAHKGEIQRAKEMFEKAVEINPMYVMARCNLASFALDDEAVEQAEDLLAPLESLRTFSTQEFVFLSFMRARIAFHREEFDLAQNQLEMALQLDPEYEPVLEMRERLTLIQNLRSGIVSWRERIEKRQKVARTKLQKKISNPNPTIAEALSIFTKESMTGMARVINLHGGWSGLKKAELYNYLWECLQDQYLLLGLIEDLSAEERQALRMVLEHKGTLSWQAFCNQYGDDMEESPYWHYHQPKTVMGRLRVRGLLAEGIVDGELIVAIPVELREVLGKLV